MPWGKEVQEVKKVKEKNGAEDSSASATCY